MISTAPSGEPTINHKTPASPQQRNNSSQSRDSSNSTPLKYDNFIKRFKLNQHQLRNKFKNFILKQKLYFPRTHQKFNQTFLTQDSEDVEPIQNVRSIRKERQKLTEEMNQNLNQSHYYLHRNQEYQKTCTLLERRMKKVTAIREDRRSEVIKLERTLRSISESIQQEKRRYRDTIIESRDNIAKSKLMCSRRKLSQADTVRNERELFKSRISMQKAQYQSFNRLKYQMVKADQRNAELSVSRVIEQNINKAQEVKLERLFRELAEKEQVKINATMVRKETSTMISRYKNKTIELQEKIGEYRKSLGEQKLELPSKIPPFKFHNRRYFTEENQFSTKSGFLTASKQVNYADEPFDD